MTALAMEGAADSGTLYTLEVNVEENVITTLEGALKSAKMTMAEFGKIFPELEDLLPYPTTEEEVTAFIKQRTEIYRNSWLIMPIESALRMLRGV